MPYNSSAKEEKEMEKEIQTISHKKKFSKKQRNK
jgi:hypothetical protein